MIKTSNEAATATFRKERAACNVCHAFVSFVHQHYPTEELGQYKLRDWRALADSLGVKTAGKSAADLQSEISRAKPTYRELLRKLV